MTYLHLRTSHVFAARFERDYFFVKDFKRFPVSPLGHRNSLLIIENIISSNIYLAAAHIVLTWSFVSVPMPRQLQIQKHTEECFCICICICMYAPPTLLSPLNGSSVMKLFGRRRNIFKVSRGLY